MAAFLLLDDDAQSYTNAEIYFLRRLALAFPAGIVIRSCHQEPSPSGAPNASPLTIAVDLRIGEQITISPEFTRDFDPRQAALVRRSVQKVADQARRVLREFLQAINPPGKHDCPKCGAAMSPIYNHSKQNLGRPSGYTCDGCGETEEDKALAEFLARAMHEHGSPYDRRRV